MLSQAEAVDKHEGLMLRRELVSTCVVLFAVVEQQ